MYIAGIDATTNVVPKVSFKESIAKMPDNLNDKDTIYYVKNTDNKIKKYESYSKNNYSKFKKRTLGASFNYLEMILGKKILSFQIVKFSTSLLKNGINIKKNNIKKKKRLIIIKLQKFKII